MDIDKKDELVRYYYDKANQLVKTTVEGNTTQYTYDLAGNLLSDGDNTYTYDTQNRLLTKTGADGTTTYTYDAAGNLIKETNPDGTVSYTYNAQNKLIKGELSDGQSSTYTYNALGIRIENVQIRENENRGYQNAPLNNGSTYIKDYTGALSDFRALWQRVWETEVGTVVQNDFETVTKHYIVDYLSVANRDIMVTEDGSFVQRYVYDENGKRISAEFSYADGTARGAVNANGEYGENPQSDFAAERGKVWYRQSHLGSTLFAVDASGEVVAHTIYNAWGNPLVDTYPDANFSGFENTNNYTGYTYDETLALYFAQNRFYDAENHRFTQEDTVKDGENWYVYCGNNPLLLLDPWGLTPTDDLWALDLSAIRSINTGGRTYYNLSDILGAIGGTAFWSDADLSSHYSISTSIAGRHVKSLGITVQQGGSPQVLSDGTVVYQGSVTGSSDTDYFTDTIGIYNRGGTNYVSYEELFSYFERVWCETGKQALSHAAVAAAVARYDLTERQAEALRKINDYYRNYPELLDKATTVFAFEGVNSGTMAWGGDTTYHPYGQFDAMFVSVRNGEIVALTTNASTLPDRPDYYNSVRETDAFVTQEGLYALKSYPHNKYAAGKLYDFNNDTYGRVVTWRNGKSDDAGGIDFHAAAPQPTKPSASSSYSTGCLTIHVDDYIQFASDTGLLNGKDFVVKGNSPYDRYKYVKANLNNSYRNTSFSGNIVIDRSALYEKLNSAGNSEAIRLYFGN